VLILCLLARCTSIRWLRSASPAGDHRALASVLDGPRCLRQTPQTWRKALGLWMRKSFIVLSGTGVKEFRKWAPSANYALDLVRSLMKLRRPGVRIEDERGNPVSFFQLKEIAETEDRKRMIADPTAASTAWPARV
jgi:hypothetical protein